MFTEYHNIVATMIQRKWKKYIVQKKIWCMLKPDDPISLKMKKNQNNILNKIFKRIHVESTHFRTMVVKYNYNMVNKIIEINFIKNKNCYTIYDIEEDTIYEIDNININDVLNKFENIISIKIQAIITNTNSSYGYPEIIQIKAY